MCELTADFFENNDHALRSQKIVLRDSLGTLAVQILASRRDISHMNYDEMLSELYGIINDLHHAYVAMDNSGLLDFASGAAKMGIAFDTTAEQAGEWMAKWRTSFTLTQSEAVTLADKINYLGNKSAANAQQISEIVTKIGPLGKVAGLANGEIAAMGATLVAVGVQEDVAATGIKKVMTSMTAGSAATKRQRAVLDQLGISATDLAARMQTDAQGAILDFMGALGKLPEAEQAAALKNYFGEESVAAIAPLLTQLGLLKDHFDMVGDASQYAGSMESEFAARAATSENSFELLKNAIKELSDTFGKIFVPNAENGMQALTQIIHNATDFVKKNPELIKTVTKAAAGFSGLQIAGLSAKLGFEYVSLGSNLAKKALEIFKGKAADSAATAATGGGKIASLGKSLFGYFGNIKNALGGVDASMSKFDFAKNLMTKFNAGSLGQLIKGQTSGIVNSLLSPFKAVRGKVGSLLSPISNNITGFLGGIGGAITNGPIGKIGGVFKSLGSVSGALLQPLGGLSGMFGGLFGKIMPIIAIVSLLATLFIKLNGGDISGFIAPLQSAFEAVKPTLTAVMEQLKGLGTKVMPMLMDAANQLAPLFFQIAASILPVLASLLQAIMPVLTTVAETLLPVLIGVLTTLMPPLTNLITSILPVIKTLIDALIPVIMVLANVFADGLGGAINAIMPIVQHIINVFQSLIDFITGVFTGNWKQAWEGIKGIFGGVFGGLVELVKAPFRVIISTLNGVIEGLNKIKVPDWVPNIGGQGISIPLIPTFEKGTNYTPDTFIAGDVGGKGGELVTGARGRKVFTAAQTRAIFDNINAANSVVSMRKPESLNAAALSVKNSRNGAPITINYNATFQVDENSANDIDQKLRESEEQLINLIERHLRKRADDERRTVYD